MTTLLGHAQVGVAERCLPTLVRLSSDPLRLRLHDDGSLTVGDLERLRARIGEVDVVWRREADEAVSTALAMYPNLRRFRSANPLALKLIDPLVLAEDEVWYCDADVLFLRPFRDLFQRAQHGAVAVFMSDRQNAYSLRSWDLLRHRQLRLLRRVNSGIVRFPRRSCDWQLLDWFLGREELRRSPVWVEQTAWALLGATVPTRLLDPSQVVIPLPHSVPDRAYVAAHFVSPVRDLLAGWSATGEQPGDGEPLLVESLPAVPATICDLAADELRRARRRLG